MFLNFISDIKFYSKSLYYDQIPIYHWGQIENFLYRKKMAQYNIYFPLNFIDINQIFKKQQIFIKGALDYSLKSIGKAMYNNNLISIIWKDDINNGFNAMFEYFKLLKSSDYNKSVHTIVEYNYVDIKILHEILSWLRQQ